MDPSPYSGGRVLFSSGFDPKAGKIQIGGREEQKPVREHHQQKGPGSPLLPLVSWELAKHPGHRSRPASPGPFRSCLPCCVLCLVPGAGSWQRSGPWSQMPPCPVWAAQPCQAILPSAEYVAVISGHHHPGYDQLCPSVCPVTPRLKNS